MDVDVESSHPFLGRHFENAPGYRPAGGMDKHIDRAKFRGRLVNAPDGVLRPADVGRNEHAPPAERLDSLGERFGRVVDVSCR